MDFLFVDKNCQSCTQSFINKVKKLLPSVEIIHIEYNSDENKYLAYRNGEKLGEESPVSSTPALFLESADELVLGQRNILSVLI